MPSERVVRQIERFLDEAEQAMAAGDWPLVRTRAEDALALDPDNADASTCLAVAQTRLGSSQATASEQQAANRGPAT